MFGSLGYDSIMDKRYPEAHRLPKAVRAGLITRVRSSLMNSDAAIERAIKVLYDRQTLVEKQAKESLTTNSLGVKKCHGVRIVRYGKWIASGRPLSGIHLTRARQLAMSYSRTQLFELAAVAAGYVAP